LTPAIRAIQITPRSKLCCVNFPPQKGREIIAPDPMKSQALLFRPLALSGLVPEGISPGAAYDEAPSK